MRKKVLSLAKFPENALHSYKHKYSVCEEYRGLPKYNQMKKAALSASDNGRCWWIYEYLMIERI